MAFDKPDIAFSCFVNIFVSPRFDNGAAPGILCSWSAKSASKKRQKTGSKNENRWERRIIFILFADCCMQLQYSTIHFDTLWQKASLFIVIVSCMKLKRKCRTPDRWSPPATKVPCKSDTRPLPFRLSTRRRDVKLFLNSTVCKQTISNDTKKNTRSTTPFHLWLWAI